MAARILILMTSPLDAIAHALRVVSSIKRQLPYLRIDWVVRDVFAPLVKSCAAIDETLAFKRNGSISDHMRLVRQIRAGDYEYVLDFEGHARTGIIAWLSKGSHTIGRPDAREGATFCYKEIVPKPPAGKVHTLDAMLEFSRVFGLKAELRGEPEFKLGSADQFAVEEGAKRVCLFPGRRKAQRAWPGFGKFARRLLESRDDVVVYFLGETWIPVADNLREQFPDRFFDLQAKLEWPEIVSLLGASSLTIANDNGPAQLAGALGCPNLTLYSFVLSERRGTYPTSDPLNAVLQAPEGDVQKLSVEAVLTAAQKLLAF